METNSVQDSTQDFRHFLAAANSRIYAKETAAVACAFFPYLFDMARCIAGVKDVD